MESPVLQELVLDSHRKSANCFNFSIVLSDMGFVDFALYVGTSR